MEQIRAAILGSGNIATDLMYKLKRSSVLRRVLMAGIVADSDPQREYEETVNKARAMMKALAMASQPGTQ